MSVAGAVLTRSEPIGASLKLFTQNGEMTFLSKMATELRTLSRPSSKNPHVSIIIVNWNGKHLLEKCLATLRGKTEYSNYSVIVVDNGSTDGSIEFLSSAFPWVDVLALNRNYGFAIANNRGIVYALKKYDPDYILLLNNDTIIVRGNWLAKMLETAESDERIGIVGCKLIYPSGKVQHIGTKVSVSGFSWIDPSIYGNLSGTLEVDAVLGACLLIKRELIDTIGLLDEGFSPFQHEETDYCIRARKAGYKICVTLDTEVVHLLCASVKKVRCDYFKFIDERNRIRFILLNFSKIWLILHLPYEVRRFLSCLFKRDRTSLLGVKFRENWKAEVALYVRSWIANLRKLKEIIALRKNRGKKIRPH